MLQFRNFEFSITGKGLEGSMGQWRVLMDQAKTAKRTMLGNRPAGEREFDRLLAEFPNDGMVYFQRGEALEALGEKGLAAADFCKAEGLFPMASWKTSARQAAARTRGNPPSPSNESAQTAPPTPPLTRSWVREIVVGVIIGAILAWLGLSK
jgi:hypothetical protein